MSTARPRATRPSRRRAAIRPSPATGAAVCPPSQAPPLGGGGGEGQGPLTNGRGNRKVRLLGSASTPAAPFRSAMPPSGADTVLHLPNGEPLPFRNPTAGSFADRQFL